MTPDTRVVDLNADLGESSDARLGDDEAMLEVVTSANVACGCRAGDALTMRQVCARAVACGVAIGAQVSYRDLAGFGRRETTVPPEELTAEILHQIAALDGIARAEGGRVSYVKPHSALYNRSASDLEQARAIAAAVASYDPALPLLTLPGSATETAALDMRLRVVTEAFADRGYADDGTLVPRDRPGAVLTEPDVVASRAVSIVTEGIVETIAGHLLELSPQSVCVHSDTPGAVQLASAVREALVRAGVTLAPFA